LLQIGRGHSPAALQIAIEPISEHIAKSLVCLKLLSELHAGLASVKLEGEVEYLEDVLGQFVV
jgi:hypothetical protein